MTYDAEKVCAKRGHDWKYIGWHRDEWKVYECTRCGKREYRFKA